MGIELRCLFGTVPSPRRTGAGALAVILFVGGFLVAPVRGQAEDSISLGSLSADYQPGLVVAVPIYIVDTSGTALDADGDPGRTIQSLSLTVEPSPMDAVTAIDFVRDGVAAAPLPRFETTEISDGARRSWIVAFDETLDPLPLSLDAAAPGDLVGALLVTLSGSAFPGQVVDLILVPATSAVGNHPGSVAETVANGQLLLGHGEIMISGLFYDGFESGDTQLWSVSVP
jgi:hypothetical protein